MDKARYDVSQNLDTFGVRLRQLLEEHGYSLADVAFSTGVASATLSRYLSNQRVPDLRIVLMLCKFFNVSSDWLCGLTNEASASDVPEIVKLYNRATSDDKEVVNTVLKKYKK